MFAKKRSYMDSHNWDANNPKESTILTPVILCNYIYEIIPKNFKRVFDIGCYNGNLSRPFKEHDYECMGIDNQKIEYHSTFILEDFLKMSNDSIGIANDDLIVCNPPFNDKERIYGRKLLPELFLKKIIELWGTKAQIVLISPMGLRLNQKIKSSRWRWMRDNLEITGILSLPLDLFDKVKFHAEVIFFNIQGMKAHYFLNLP